MSILEQYQAEEELCIKKIKKRAPNHPILKKFFHSTYAAVEAYWEVLRELDRKKV